MSQKENQLLLTDEKRANVGTASSSNKILGHLKTSRPWQNNYKMSYEGLYLKSDSKIAKMKPNVQNIRVLPAVNALSAIRHICFAVLLTDLA